MNVQKLMYLVFSILFISLVSCSSDKEEVSVIDFPTNSSGERLIRRINFNSVYEYLFTYDDLGRISRLVCNGLEISDSWTDTCEIKYLESSIIETISYNGLKYKVIHTTSPDGFIKMTIDTINGFPVKSEFIYNSDSTLFKELKNNSEYISSFSWSAGNIESTDNSSYTYYQIENKNTNIDLNYLTAYYVSTMDGWSRIDGLGYMYDKHNKNILLKRTEAYMNGNSWLSNEYTFDEYSYISSITVNDHLEGSAYSEIIKIEYVK